MAKAAWWGFGAIVYAAATAMLFLLIEAWIPRQAVGVALATMIGVPLAAAAVLTPRLRRVDPAARFFLNALGLCGVWALVVVVAVLAFARGPLADALIRFPDRHPHAGARVHAWSTYLGRRLVPTPASRPASSEVPATDVRVLDAGAEPSGAARGPHVTAVGTLEAGPIEPVADASITSAAGTHDAPRLFADVSPCEMAFDVQVADFDRDGVDEVLVKCIESAHVLALTRDDTLVELLRFEPAPPPDLKRTVGAPGVGDADGDGTLDVLLCATWATDRGGTRGGQTWFAPGRGNNLFGDLVVLDRGPCNAVGMHDVTGDGVAELLIVQTGNPWQEDHPNGSVAWLAKSGKAWKARGRLPTRTYPDGMSFADANGDSISDVIVSHGWSSDDATVLLLGGRGGLRAAPDTLAVPPGRDRKHAAARFDRDGRPDEVALDLRGRVQLFRTQPLPKPTLRDIEPRR